MVVSADDFVVWCGGCVWSGSLIGWVFPEKVPEGDCHNLDGMWVFEDSEMAAGWRQCR